MDKIVDIKNDKFMYLDSALRNRNGFITLFFTSAKNQYRANLVDRRNGNIRPNPKTHTEGEQQKTHLSIQVEQHEVKVVVEKNGNGVSINQIVEYLNRLNRSLSNSVNHIIGYNHIVRSDFRQQIMEFSRVVLAELYVEKSVLGDGVLNYSNRTTTIQSDIMLKIKPQRGESIKNAILDIFSVFNNGSRAPINRLKIKGVDNQNNNIILDTFDFVMTDSAFFDTNPQGEIETSRAYTILIGFLGTF